VATASLDDLLRSILTYSYSSAGKLDSQPKPLDLVTFCQEQIELLQTSIGQQHEFHFTARSDDPRSPGHDHCKVWLDEQLLWHLLTNLLANAIKYSPAVPTTTGKIDLQLTWTPDRVSLTVRDNGIGIPPESVAQLFEPFYRADNTGDIPGTGLGLALVKQCADRQGGSVRIEAGLAKGSGFVVDLPRDSRGGHTL
jgi:signal transduction histidine kinase